VAKQASSPSLCASVRALPWADEAEQQLSRLAPSACELSADIHVFRVGMLEVPGRDPHPRTSLNFEVARQAFVVGNKISSILL